jgi:hypothetical protein
LKGGGRGEKNYKEIIALVRERENNKALCIPAIITVAANLIFRL